MKQLGILVFDEVEVLDFAGPFEVFSVANQLADYKLIQVHVLSLDALEIRAKNGLHVVADQRLDQVGQLDYLVQTLIGYYVESVFGSDL
jgi:transcriptional regulator GlxA family with amidase domain